MPSDGGDGLHRNSTESRQTADHRRVLIVSISPINRIVISRTAEGVYLKPVAVAPEAALRSLRENAPGIVIIETASSNDALKPLMSELAMRRQKERLPRVLLIADPHTHRDMPPLEGLFDAVVPKPITPDSLQPVLERLSRA